MRPNTGGWIVRLLAALLLTVFAPGMVRAETSPALLVQPGVGVGYIRIGESREDLLAALGASETEAGVLDNKDEVFQYWSKKLTVLVRAGKVFSIACLNPNYRTAGGVGVGSTISEVESALGSTYERKQGGVGPELSYASGIRFLCMDDRVLGIEVRAPSK